MIEINKQSTKPVEEKILQYDYFDYHSLRSKHYLIICLIFKHISFKMISKKVLQQMQLSIQPHHNV